MPDNVKETESRLLKLEMLLMDLTAKVEGMQEQIDAAHERVDLRTTDIDNLREEVRQLKARW